MTSARIRLERRDGGYADRLRAYRVVLDGTEVGPVSRGGESIFETSPGHHQLHLKLDWCRSPPVAFDLAAGQEARLRCWPNARPWFALYWITLGRRRYIGIELLDVLDGPPSSAIPATGYF